MAIVRHDGSFGCRSDCRFNVVIQLQIRFGAHWDNITARLACSCSATKRLEYQRQPSIQQSHKLEPSVNRYFPTEAAG